LVKWYFTKLDDRRLGVAETDLQAELKKLKFKGSFALEKSTSKMPAQPLKVAKASTVARPP
jgi:hypothetical protein